VLPILVPIIRKSLAGRKEWNEPVLLRPELLLTRELLILCRIKLRPIRMITLPIRMEPGFEAISS